MSTTEENELYDILWHLHTLGDKLQDAQRSYDGYLFHHIEFIQTMMDRGFGHINDMVIGDREATK